MVSSWKMAIPVMELNFMKGFCPSSMEVIFFNFFFFGVDHSLCFDLYTRSACECLSDVLWRRKII